MYPKVMTLLVAALFLVPARATFAQETDPDAQALTTLLAKIRVDLKSGKRTEVSLADDLEQFDVLLAAENGKRTEVAANILLSKGMIYSEVLDDPERAKTFFLEIKKNYSNTAIAGKLDPLLAMMDQQAESKRDSAEAGRSTVDFKVVDVLGRPLSVSQYKGRVVLIDFWAAWSPSTEMTNVIATYNQYHERGFEVIGVNLDDDLDKFLKYTRENGLAWPEYYDGLRFQNKLAVKYNIQALPANFLIDTGGNLIATNVVGPDLPAAVAKALSK